MTYMPAIRKFQDNEIITEQITSIEEENAS